LVSDHRWPSDRCDLPDRHIHLIVMMFPHFCNLPDRCDLFDLCVCLTVMLWFTLRSQSRQAELSTG
jgi:hypothetical protein